MEQHTYHPSLGPPVHLQSWEFNQPKIDTIVCASELISFLLGLVISAMSAVSLEAHSRLASWQTDGRLSRYT